MSAKHNGQYWAFVALSAVADCGLTSSQASRAHFTEFNLDAIKFKELQALSLLISCNLFIFMEINMPTQFLLSHFTVLACQLNVLFDKFVVFPVLVY